MSDQDIIDKFYKGKISVFSTLNKNGKVTKAEMDYLENRFNDSTGIEETLYRIKFNIETHPLCPICKKPVKWDKYGKFNEYCSRICVNKREGFKERREKTCKEKYGVKSVLSLKEVRQKTLESIQTNNVKEKRKQTCLEKYGVETPLLLEESKIKSKQNNHTPEVLEKRKQTCLEKYGVTTHLLLEEIKERAQINSHTLAAREKAKETTYQRHGVKGWTEFKYVQDLAHSKEAREKAKETTYQRYGVETVLVLPENKEKCRMALNKKEIREKMVNTNFERYPNNYGNRIKTRETWLEKYGVEHPRMLEKSKQHMSKIMSSEEMQIRRYNKMKENNSFNKSTPEEQTYNLLISKFNKVIRQYKDKRYPFVCDFFIPSLDLFIECNYHWTHGKHPYNPDLENDISLYKKWLSKDTKFYKNAIKTWTIRDVNKIKIAKENGLNYLTFYSIEEFKEWFEKQ